MDPITLAMMGAAGGSLLSGLGGFLGSKGQSGASSQAAMISAMLQQQAMQQAQQRYQDASSKLDPYINSGSKSMDLLMGYLQGGAQGIGGGGSSLLATFNPTMAQLEQTPGYKFILDQGTKAANNSAAARGLGSSGNAVQGGVQFASGLASTTWQQQLDAYLKQQQQAYNMLMGAAQLGSGAAGVNMQGATGFNGQSLNMAGNIGNTLSQGIMSGANANAQGTNLLFNGAGNALTLAGMLQNQYGKTNNNPTNLGTNSPAFGGATYTNPLMSYATPQAEWAQPYSL